MTKDTDRITNRQRRIRDAYDLWINKSKGLHEAAEQMLVEPKEILDEMRRRTPLKYYRARWKASAIVARAILGMHADNLVSNIRRRTRV